MKLKEKKEMNQNDRTAECKNKEAHDSRDCEKERAGRKSLR